MNKKDKYFFRFLTEKQRRKVRQDVEKEIGILIPAHNEEEALPGLVRELKKKFPLVVVVDDGSGDRTAEVARENGAVVLEHQTCRGKGAALGTGFEYLVKCGCRAILTMDGDGQHKIKDVEKFVAKYRMMPWVDIWVGTRSVRGTDMPFMRRLTNVSMSLLISLLSLQFIPDSQSGFRLIKSYVVSGIRFVSAHFETESELLIKASLRGARIRPVLIETVYEKEKSKINPVSDTRRFFKMLFLMFFNLWKKR